MTTNLQQLRHCFANIRSWQRGATVAPHKPLLLLYALGRLQAGKPRLVPFTEAEVPLRQLLEEFGPRRASYHPEYPFWHLQREGLWELVPRPTKKRTGSGNVSAGALREIGASGGFPEDVFQLLVSQPEVAAELAQGLLSTNFSESLHTDLLAAVGLAIYTGATRLPRDPRFRSAVIDAYGRSCAVCGFDVRLGSVSLAVEAAHIRWHQHGGPSHVANGLCLCSSHHKIFDLGGFTLTDELRIEVADAIGRTESAEHWLWAFDGRPLRVPKREQHLPSPTHLAWHRREVFKAIRPALVDGEVHQA